MFARSGSLALAVRYALVIVPAAIVTVLFFRHVYHATLFLEQMVRLGGW